MMRILTPVPAVSVFVVLLSINAAAEVVTDGLVHQWNIERGEGGLPDNQIKDSVGNRDGTFVASPTWSDDMPGVASSSSLRFDNADGDSVNIGDLRATIDSTKPFTVEAWGKALKTDHEHGHVLFSAGNARARPFGMQFCVDGFVYAGRSGENFVYRLRVGAYAESTSRRARPVWNEAESAASPYELDTWYQVVTVYKGKGQGADLYLNGVKQTSTGFTEEFSDGSSARIGGLGTERTGWFEGLIDQVRIYNRALTQEEIEQNYRAMRPHAPFIPKGSVLAAQALGLDVMLQQPFVSTEAVLPIEIRMDLASEKIAEAKLRITLVQSGQVIQELAPKAKEAVMTVDLPVAQLEPGDYTVDIQLVDAADQTVGSVKKDFTKYVAPGKPRKVTIGDDGVCYVNGKAMLPLGFWLASEFPGPTTMQGTDYSENYNVALWRVQREAYPRDSRCGLDIAEDADVMGILHLGHFMVDKASTAFAPACRASRTNRHCWPGF